jgi:hypothetical protein
VTGLPAWWLALAEQARAGLAQGRGPWWSERFLCGQPLFGAPELPFGGPAAGLLLGLGAAGPALWLVLHALLLSAGLTLWLRQDGAALGLNRRNAGWAAFLAVAAGLVHPEAAALLGVWAWLPWVLLLAGRAPAWVAAPFAALLACAASPLTLLLGLVGSGKAAGWGRTWGRTWGLALGLAAPVLLETLRLAPGTGSVAWPQWQFGWLGSPLLLSQAGLALFTWLLLAAGWLRGRETLGLTLAAAALALGGPLFSPKGLSVLPSNQYVRPLTRHQAAPGALPETLPNLLAERWTGAQGGLAPEASLRRWRQLSAPGPVNADLLSLAAAGWVDNDAPQVWHQAVPAAVVDGAEGLSERSDPSSGLFQRPLRVDTVDAGARRGYAWHLFSPRAVAPGCWTMDLGGGTAAGNWAYLSESSDPGWSAEAAGPAGIGRRSVASTEGSFVAAPMQGSEGTLTWLYRPPSLVFGLFLALAGLLLWAFMANLGPGLFGR